MTVIATGSVAFVRGDAFTLANYIGATASAAKKYAGVWIKFTPKDRAFYAKVHALAALPIASVFGNSSG